MKVYITSTLAITALLLAAFPSTQAAILRSLFFLLVGHNTSGINLFTHIEVVRDQRAMRIRWQSSENNDDVTALQYHPSHDDMLLSGGDDGLVSIFNTSIQDEMDSMIQAFSHGPVHKAGFLSDKRIYALSADQQFSIQPVESSDSDGPDIIQPVVFGDLRPIAQCDYVIDVHPNNPNPYVVTGSHLRYRFSNAAQVPHKSLTLMSSDPHIDLIPLVANPEFTFAKDNIIRLQGAHGEEIVRSICLDASVWLAWSEAASYADLHCRTKPSSLAEKMDVSKVLGLLELR